MQSERVVSLLITLRGFCRRSSNFALPPCPCTIFGGREGKRDRRTRKGGNIGSGNKWRRREENGRFTITKVSDEVAWYAFLQWRGGTERVCRYKTKL